LGLAPNQKHQAFLGAPKVVHCGEKIEEEAIRKGGLKFLRPIYYRAFDSPLDCTLTELIPS
jgi:hypothetical protein